MVKRKSFLTVLISLLILCVTLGVIPFFSGNTASAATAYNLLEKGSDAKAIYSSRWTEQGNRSYGETSGKWYFGSGDLTNSSSTGKGTYTFTQSSKQSNGFHDGDALALFYTIRMSTKIYNSRKQSATFVWEAEDYGTVKFTGLFAKANTAFTTLCETQNGKTIDFGNLNINQSEYAWHDGGSYTITMWKVANYGSVTQYIPYEKTYTSEYVHLIPQKEFKVFKGDKFFFTLKCNAESDDWKTGTLALIDATFTKQVDQNAVNKETITATNKLSSFHVISDTHMSGADAKYLPTLLADMKTVDKDASAILNLGDLTDLGVSTTKGDQLTAYYNQLASNYLTNSLGQRVPYYNIIGNHDVRGDINVNDPNEDYYGNAMAKYITLEGAGGRNWVREVGGVRLIGLNTCQYEWDDTTLSAEDLVWLDNQLTEGETVQGKPQFVLIHASEDNGGVRSQGNVTFRQVIEKHPSAIVMSGHTHDAFGTAKISETASGAHFINMPGVNWNIALSKSWDATDGLAWSYAGNTPTLQYYYIEVYEGGVILRARDCTTGTWMTDADVAILASVNKEDVESSTSESMVAWYKFNTVESAHIDATGNYTATNKNTGVLATDGITIPTDGYPMVYASSAAQNPFTYFKAGQKFTISMLYYTGSSGGGSGFILTSGPNFSGHFAVYHSWGDFVIRLPGNEKITFKPNNKAWVRLTIWYDGANVNATMHDITNNTNIASSGSIAIASLNLSTGTTGFGIGNKSAYSADGTAGASAGLQATDHKFADLRFYACKISDDEVARINRGDLGYRSEANLQFSYRPFGNGSVSTDVTGYNTLTSSGASFDEDTASAKFDQSGYVVANNNSYYNAKTGKYIANDFSDYMKKSKFSVSFRMFMMPTYIDGTSYTYYAFTTGKYSDSFTIAAEKNAVQIYLGRGAQAGEGGETCVYLNFADILSVNTSGQWIRGVVTYDGATFNGSCYNEANKQTYTPILYNASGVVVSDNAFTGGSFGGYGYVTAFGGQTSDGVNAIAQTSYKVAGTSARSEVKVSRLDVWSGIISQSQINELNALDDKVASEFKSSADTHAKVAHYTFSNSSNLGLVSVNGYNLTNAGGIIVDSANGGIVLGAVNGSSSNKYLYAPNVYGKNGVDIFDKYRGSMSVSFRARIKSTSTAYTILGSGVNGKGMYIAVKGTGLEVQSGSSVLTFSDIFTSSLEWYRINVIFDYTAQKVTVTAARQVDDVYINGGSQSRTLTDVGFGGAFYQTFTVGGVADQKGQGLLAGATDGAYTITLTDLRIYSGVINSNEIASINQFDAQNIKLDTNSKVNAALTKDLALNYWLKANGGKNFKFNFAFNGHSYENVTSTYKEISANSKDYYWMASVTGMAPQDMNDAIVLNSVTFEYQGARYTLDISGWAWKNTSMKQYLLQVIDLAGTSTKEGKLAVLALNYGAESQKLTNHDTANLVNASLSADLQKLSAWNDSLVAQGGAVANAAIRNALQSQGNGSVDIFSGLSVAPRYDNKLGWGIFVKLVDEQADFTLQLTDANDVVLAEVSKSQATKVGEDAKYLVEIDGVIDISDLAKEFRIKIFANGEQQYYTIRYNYMSTIMNSYDSATDGNLIKCVYSLYATAIA